MWCRCFVHVYVKQTTTRKLDLNLNLTNIHFIQISLSFVLSYKNVSPFITFMYEHERSYIIYFLLFTCQHKTSLYFKVYCNLFRNRIAMKLIVRDALSGCTTQRRPIDDINTTIALKHLTPPLRTFTFN